MRNRSFTSAEICLVLQPPFYPAAEDEIRDNTADLSYQTGGFFCGLADRQSVSVVSQAAMLCDIH